ncbi:hypothetical protein LY78DRAFT_662881 [Colletotrichum sublineola]|nr:hypothetical protein LY78DRAFT_662881 [Colletotrichum sublineola]
MFSIPLGSLTDALGSQPEFGKCGYVPYPVPTSAKPQPSAVSSTTTATPSSTSMMHCTGGTRAEGFSDGFLGLCSYGCDYNHCPQDVCVCTRSESVAIPAPTGSGHGCPGTAEPGSSDYAYYADLCDFACSHGYCPDGA